MGENRAGEEGRARWEAENREKILTGDDAFLEIDLVASFRQAMLDTYGLQSDLGDAGNRSRPN